jgi:hypothetical protein
MLVDFRSNYFSRKCKGYEDGPWRVLRCGQDSDRFAYKGQLSIMSSKYETVSLAMGGHISNFQFDLGVEGDGSSILSPRVGCASHDLGAQYAIDIAKIHVVRGTRFGKRGPFVFLALFGLFRRGYGLSAARRNRNQRL